MQVLLERTPFRAWLVRKIMPKRWRFRPHDQDRIRNLERTAGVSPVVAQLLLCRGIDQPDLAQNFLEPRLTGLRDPGELPGAMVAAQRLVKAIRDGEQIVIFGDYDVDGITGTSLLYLGVQLLGGKVKYHIPHRTKDGYGLSIPAIENLAKNGAQVVVTVDCGIASIEPARRARELGLDLIITDHHQFGAELPDAHALVHPALPGHSYPFHGLCGSGVAFKLAWAMCQVASDSDRVKPNHREYLMRAMVLSSLGTVADVVPLLDENRILVRHGLLGLKERPVLGLQMLLKVMKSHNKPYYDSEDIGFGIAPRINAAGRLGQARLAVELLTTESESRATELAEYLDQLNENRKSLERKIYLAARKQAIEDFDPEGDSALVLADRNWHAGVIGIVAGRLAERFHRPVIMISLDEAGSRPGVGSARSVPGFDLYAGLAECQSHLVNWGGHRAAAGLKIEEAQLDAFRASFCEHASEALTDEMRVAELEIDAEAPLSSFTLKTVGQIELLAPFGQGNTRPVLSTTKVQLARPPRCIGAGERHLALELVQNGIKMRAIAFGQAEWAEPLSQHNGSLSVAFQPIINVFNGRRNVELHLRDWLPEHSSAAAGTSSALSNGK